ncbi:MAG: TetR/AcrR family transcriptional regulator [Planctomycetota bacterium]|jgi:AcrR family transcriptional regulator
MPKVEKRRQIMSAAEKLFTGRRVHEITLDEVARAAKVGKGTIYRYFKDKDDLFFQVVTSGFDELCELLNERVPGNAPFRKQLLSACRKVTDFFAKRRQLFRMMQAEDGRMHWVKGKMHKSWAQRHRKLRNAMAGIVEKGVAEGEIRGDIPAEVLATFLLGMLRTRAHMMKDMPDKQRRHEVLVDLFCCGAKGNSN